MILNVAIPAHKAFAASRIADNEEVVAWELSPCYWPLGNLPVTRGSHRKEHNYLRRQSVFSGVHMKSVSELHTYTIIHVAILVHRAFPGPLFTKKTSSYGYRDPNYKPNTVWWPSQVYNGNPYTDKTASSLWIEAQDPASLAMPNSMKK